MYNFVTSKKLFYLCQIKIIWQIFRQKKIKINKMSTKKVKNYVPCSPTAFPWTKKSTKFFSQSPPTRFPPSTHTHTHTHTHKHTQTHTHTHTHTHTLTNTPTHYPKAPSLETVLTPLPRVFETSLQTIFVINWMSRCKQESLTFAVNWRSFSRVSHKTRIFLKAPPATYTFTEDSNLSFTGKSC